MALFKNLHRLKDLSENDHDMIEHASRQHAQFSSIYFKLIENSPDRVVISVHQRKSDAKNYQTKSRLIEIVNETFGRFFPGKKIVVNATPFKECPADKVNAKWILSQMYNQKIDLKHLAEDTGLNYNYLSSVINMEQEPSSAARAALYYYFKYKSLMNKL